MKNLRIKAARAGLDISQAELAEKVGVSRQTISAIEKGADMIAIISGFGTGIRRRRRYSRRRSSQRRNAYA